VPKLSGVIDTDKSKLSLVNDTAESKLSGIIDTAESILKLVKALISFMYIENKTKIQVRVNYNTQGF
jgi:hypothetical protein